MVTVAKRKYVLAETKERCCKNFMMIWVQTKKHFQGTSLLAKIIDGVTDSSIFSYFEVEDEQKSDLVEELFDELTYDNDESGK